MGNHETCLDRADAEPESTKLNLGESLPKGVSRTYTAEDKDDCPDYIEKLLCRG